MKTKWTLALFLLIVIDAATTAFFFQEEANSLILYVMDFMNIGLTGAMFLKVIYSAPLICIVDQYGTKYVQTTFWLYLILYEVWIMTLLISELLS
jgi:hypothetical protein